MSRIMGVRAIVGKVEHGSFARSETLSSHYGYMLNGTALDCQPFGRDARDIPAAELESYGATGAASVLDAGTFACDAAIAAARTLISGAEGPDRVKGLIYCHSAIDECNEWVPATRVAKELHLVDPLCFSVSQVSHCSLFHAMKFMDSQMLVEPELAKVLIVAADKWLYPFFRSFGGLGPFGDGAGALLLAADAGDGAVVRRVDLAPADPEMSPFSGAMPAGVVDRLAARAVNLLRAALRRAGTGPEEVDCLVGPAAPGALARAVEESLGISSGRAVEPPPEGHLSAADPLSMLSRAWEDVSRAGAVSLWWTYGTSGEIGCAVLEGTGVGGGGGRA